MAEINTPDVKSQTTPENKKSSPQFKKIALPLIVIIVLLAIVTIFLNSKMQKAPAVPPFEETQTPTSQISPQAQSILSLMPNPLTLDASGRGIIDVNIETGGNEVTAVQLQLQYDTKAISNVAIQPSDFFSNPVELLERIDTQNGRITYMIGISPTQDPVSGNGTVAQITFAKTRGTNLTSTIVKFSKTEKSESIVAATGIDQSVLKATNDTTINLSQ